jgi:glucokinase
MHHEKDLIGAIDIGGSKVAIGLVSEDGRVVCRRTVRTDQLPTHTVGVAAIEMNLKDCVRESGAKLAGIGVGCTGPVDPVTGTIGKVATLPGWQGCCLVDEMTARFPVPTVVENDADAAALAEAIWGRGLNVDRFLYLTISTGIGAGFLFKGNIYRGVDGSHPEMGHHVIDPSGPPCYCGASGCWESLASGNAIRNWFLENDHADRFSPDSLSAENIFELYSAGDRLAVEAIARLSYYIGLGLANLTTILVPDIIAIGGGISLGSDVFLDRAVEVFRKVCGEVPAEKTVIRTAALRNDVGLAGAAAAWYAKKM